MNQLKIQINKGVLSTKKVGIYKITNLKNSNVYIGESLYLERRFNEHLQELRNKTHHNTQLQNEFNKYGENDFSFSIIEELPVDSNNIKLTSNVKLKIILICREFAYIKKYSSITKCYNEENTLDDVLLKKKQLITSYNINLDSSSSMMKNLIKQNPKILDSNYIISEEDILLQRKNPIYIREQILKDRPQSYIKQNVFPLDCLIKLLNLEYEIRYRKSQFLIFLASINLLYMDRGKNKYIVTEYAIENNYILKRKSDLLLFTELGYTLIVNHLKG